MIKKACWFVRRHVSLFFIHIWRLYFFPLLFPTINSALWHLFIPSEIVTTFQYITSSNVGKIIPFLHTVVFQWTMEVPYRSPIPVFFADEKGSVPKPLINSNETILLKIVTFIGDKLKYETAWVIPTRRLFYTLTTWPEPNTKLNGITIMQKVLTLVRWLSPFRVSQTIQSTCHVKN